MWLGFYVLAELPEVFSQYSVTPETFTLLGKQASFFVFFSALYFSKHGALLNILSPV